MSRGLLDRFLAIGGSFAIRSVFMLALAAAVYGALPAGDAARFFQLLFFQAVLIAFLSASGFFRVQALTEDQTADMLAALLLLVPPSAVLPLGLVLAAPSYAGEMAEVLLIWTGAVTTALAGPLTGHVLGRFGPYRAFVPSALAAGLACLPVLMIADMNRLAACLILALFQCLTFALLALQVPSLVADALSRLTRGRLPKVLSMLREGAAVGGVNVLQLLIIFAARHIWEQAAAAEIAAAVFLTLRVSDAALQLWLMALSGHGIAIRVFAWRGATWTILSSGAVFFAALAVLGRTIDGALALAIAGQLLLDALRFVWSLGFLRQMALFRLARYVVFVLIPPLVALAATGVFLLSGHPMAIFALMAVFTLCGALITARQRG